MKNKKVLRSIVIIFIAITMMAIFGSVVKENIDHLLNSPELLRIFAEGHPIIGPIAIILLIILEVVIAPLPGGFLPIFTGILFGTVLGTIYSFIGSFLGAILSFTIARKFGRSIIEKLVPPKKLIFYDDFIKRHHIFIWFMYVVPLFPYDIISFSLGLSKVRFRIFATFVGLALLPDMWLLNLLGNRIYNSDISRILWGIGFLIIIMLIISLIKEFKKQKRIHEHSQSIT